jgi:hypothetical protein
MVIAVARKGATHLGQTTSKRNWIRRANCFSGSSVVVIPKPRWLPSTIPTVDNGNASADDVSTWRSPKLSDFGRDTERAGRATDGLICPGRSAAQDLVEHGLSIPMEPLPDDDAVLGRTEEAIGKASFPLEFPWEQEFPAGITSGIRSRARQWVKISAIGGMIRRRAPDETWESAPFMYKGSKTG